MAHVPSASGKSMMTKPIIIQKCGKMMSPTSRSASDGSSLCSPPMERGRAAEEQVPGAEAQAGMSEWKQPTREAKSTCDGGRPGYPPPAKDTEHPGIEVTLHAIWNYTCSVTKSEIMFLKEECGGPGGACQNQKKAKKLSRKVGMTGTELWLDSGLGDGF